MMTGSLPKNFFKLAIVSLLLIFIFSTGCNSKNSSIPDDSGTPVSIDKLSAERLTLDSAIDILNDDDIGLGMGDAPGYTIHNIIGRDLDSNGRAQIWVLSVNSTDPFYFICTQGRFYTMIWEESSKDTAIDLKTILHPEDLFINHKPLILDLTNNGISSIDELELRNGVYYLRGNHPGKIFEYTFNATTGEEIFW